jgi:hypothetical protein
MEAGGRPKDGAVGAAADPDTPRKRRKFETLRAKRPIPAPVSDTPSDEDLLAAVGPEDHGSLRCAYSRDRLHIVYEALVEALSSEHGLAT